MRLAAIISILFILAIGGPVLAQPSTLPPVTTGPGTQETGYFSIVVDPAEYPDAGDEETEDIKFISLLHAFNLLHGVEWRRVATEEEITLDKRIFAIVHDMELEEITEFGESYRYIYSYDYIVEELDEKKVGRGIEAVGESSLQNMALAWEEARGLALIDAVNQALARRYTDNQRAIPNEVRGMITTFEILYDDYNIADEIYRFKIKAWVGFERRMQEF